MLSHRAVGSAGHQDIRGRRIDPLPALTVSLSKTSNPDVLMMSRRRLPLAIRGPSRCQWMNDIMREEETLDTVHLAFTMNGK